MQIWTSQALDAAATEPLLGRRPSGVGTGGAAAAAAAPATAPRKPVAAGLRFTHHFATLVRLLRPYPAAILTLLAIAEAYVVAEGGLASRPSNCVCCNASWPATQFSSTSSANFLHGA